MIDLLNKKVRAQSLVDAVTERLEEAIITGLLEPGSRLSEQALAKSFGVSRAPLREAIRRLEGRKLLKRTPNVGVSVATISAEDVGEIIQVHEALQGMACALAAERITADEIAGLKDMIVLHEKQSKASAAKGRENASEDFDLDVEFHSRIAAASGNRRIMELLFDDLSYLIWSSHFISIARTGRWMKAVQEHKGILAALTRRDPVAAEQRMRQHIRNDWVFMKEQIQSLGSKPVEPGSKNQRQSGHPRAEVSQAVASFRLTRAMRTRNRAQHE